MNSDFTRSSALIFSLCHELFLYKLEDYGASWRVMRPVTVVDQLYIKIKRVLQIHQQGESFVDEPIEDGLMAIVNYSAIALIQFELGACDEIDLLNAEVLRFYEHIINQAKNLYASHPSTYDAPDLSLDYLLKDIQDKILRIKKKLSAHDMSFAKEGIEWYFLDLMVRGMLCLKLAE